MALSKMSPLEVNDANLLTCESANDSLSQTLTHLTSLSKLIPIGLIFLYY